MSEKTLSAEAEIVMDVLWRDYPQNMDSPIRTAGDAKRYTNLGPTACKRALAELVEAGVIVTLREDWTITDNSLLKGVYDARANATYYMLPERLEQLKEARIERLKQPVWKQAKETILEKYKEEVETEFQRLWLERMKQQ
ncbi:hypothetical protein AB0K16_21990 [Nonomuraea jabiensis]|uniref:hypothetical protein n=1 Tax=Nonomuraea jabiensis TaxID=882448 RepID=UPI0034380EF0